MAGLSPMERTALVMTAVEGATYEEAGAGARDDGRGSAPQSAGPERSGGGLMDRSRATGSCRNGPLSPAGAPARHAAARVVVHGVD